MLDSWSLDIMFCDKIISSNLSTPRHGCVFVKVVKMEGWGSRNRPLSILHHLSVSFFKSWPGSGKNLPRPDGPLSTVVVASLPQLSPRHNLLYSSHLSPSHLTQLLSLPSFRLRPLTIWPLNRPLTLNLWPTTLKTNPRPQGSTLTPTLNPQLSPLTPPPDPFHYQLSPFFNVRHTGLAP